MDAGKASKKCTPWHLSLYLPSLLSRKGGIYLLHITFDAQSVAPQIPSLTLGSPAIELLFSSLLSLHSLSPGLACFDFV